MEQLELLIDIKLFDSKEFKERWWLIQDMVDRPYYGCRSIHSTRQSKAKWLWKTRKILLAVRKLEMKAEAALIHYEKHLKNYYKPEPPQSKK